MKAIPIVDYFNKKGLSYNLSSSSVFNEVNKPDCVIKDDSRYFKSINAPDQWWQISFSIPVVISSYILRDVVSGAIMTNWSISYSYDNETFITLQTDTGIKNDKVPFNLSMPYCCKHIRITQISTSDSTNIMYFSYFECLGFIIDQKKMSMRQCNYFSYRTQSKYLL